MCNKITKISEQNKFQWIGICDHGIAHVFWRTSKICLPATELQLLMDKALAGKLPVEPLGDEYLLWLNRIAIRLTEKDFEEIQQLFSYAGVPAYFSSLGANGVASKEANALASFVLH